MRRLPERRRWDTWGQFSNMQPGKRGKKKEKRSGTEILSLKANPETNICVLFWKVRCSCRVMGTGSPYWTDLSTHDRKLGKSIDRTLDSPVKITSIRQKKAFDKPPDEWTNKKPSTNIILAKWKPRNWMHVSSLHWWRWSAFNTVSDSRETLMLRYFRKVC